MNALRWLAARRANTIDCVTMCAVLLLLNDGHWLIMFPAAFVGALISDWAERETDLHDE